MAEQQIRCAKC